MKIINTSLLTPRNIVVISVLSIAAHFLAAPVYRMVGKAATTGDE